MTSVALIPCRAGSKRLPGKNLRPLNGKPLVQWTIEAAVASGCYKYIEVCTDSDDVLKLVAERWPYPTNVELCWRDPVPDSQPDIEWVTQVMRELGDKHDTFSILRPTSPFRSAETIRRAWKQWETAKDSVDSLRAMRPVTESPYKMWWTRDDGTAYPMLYSKLAAFGEVPRAQWWNRASQDAPRQTLVQCGAIEIAHSIILPDSISGNVVSPFICEGAEAVNIDTPEDWAMAEWYLAEGLV